MGLFLVFVTAVMVIWGIHKCVIAPIFQAARRRKAQKKERKAREEASKQFKEWADRSRQKQQSWVEHYKNSPLTKEVVEHISAGGASHRPEHIAVYRDRVVGITNGVEMTYGFQENGVQDLPEGPTNVRLDGAKSLKEFEDHIQNWVRQNVALAEAINWYCGGSYTICDNNVDCLCTEGKNEILYYYDSGEAVILELTQGK